MARARSAGRITVLFVCLTLLAPWSLQAQQTDQKLSEIVGNLYFEAALLEAEAIIDVLGPVIDVDELLESLRNQLEVPFVMNSLIGAQVSSFPLGSSAGGFSWTFDPALGSF